jgi:hypothetical protein
MSTEKETIYLGVPAKDGPEHGADAFRYASKAVPLIDTDGGMTAEEAKASFAKIRRL